MSWISTADMASQVWLDHTTFDRYTRETLELSSQSLDDQMRQLKKSGSPSTSLDAATRAAHAEILAIASAIAANDAPRAKAELDSLRVSKRVVLAIADSLQKAQP